MIKGGSKARKTGKPAELCITALAITSRRAQEGVRGRESLWRNGALEQFVANKMPRSFPASIFQHLASLSMSFLTCKMGGSMSTYPRGSL